MSTLEGQRSKVDPAQRRFLYRPPGKLVSEMSASLDGKAVLLEAAKLTDGATVQVNPYEYKASDHVVRLEVFATSNEVERSFWRRVNELRDEAKNPSNILNMKLSPPQAPDNYKLPLRTRLSHIGRRLRRP